MNDAIEVMHISQMNNTSWKKNNNIPQLTLYLELTNLLLVCLTNESFLK